MSAAFYCVSDARYFLGAVAMINSLRLQGHEQPIHLLDCGLTPQQRALVEPHAGVERAPDRTPPWLAKTVLPLRHPAEVMVLIDVDMIATQPLDELIARAAGGGVVAFRDRQDRFFAEWGELLSAERFARRPYVSSGLVCCGGRSGAEAIETLDRRRDLVDFEQTFWRRNSSGYPFLYADQDVLNAILCSAPETPLLALDARLAATPPYRRLRLVDEARLHCAYADGVEPHVLHQFVRKPWLERMYHGIYSRLLARLLLGDDVAIRVPESAVPLRMRSGVRARADRTATNARDLGRFYLGDLLPSWLGSRLESRRRRAEQRA
jgi:hypothetical protein